MYVCEKKEKEELLSWTTLPVQSEESERIADEAAESVE